MLMINFKKLLLKVIESSFNKKSIEEFQDDANKTPLLRKLSSWDLIGLGIGGIIGAGIFSVIGVAYFGGEGIKPAGPSIILSFFLTAVACIFPAFAYSNLASKIPLAGSAYSYTYVTLGEFMAWIIGWCLIVEYAIGNVGVAIAWSDYFETILNEIGVTLPENFTTPYFSQHSHNAFSIDLFAFVIVVIITILLYLGIRESALTNNILVIGKLIILAIFSIWGLKYINIDNFKNFFPTGFSGMMGACGILFFAFIGFDAVSTAAEETKNPGRNLPIGIVGSLLICALIYVAVSIIFVGLIPYTQGIKERGDPLAIAIKYANKESLYILTIVSIGALIATTSVILVFQLGASRIIYRMAKDRLLPPIFAKVNPKFHTPTYSILITGLGVALLSTISTFSTVIEITNIAVLFIFLIISIANLIVSLKENGPNSRIFVKDAFISICSFLSSAVLSITISISSWIKFLIWLLLGIIVYLIIKISRKNSYAIK